MSKVIVSVAQNFTNSTQHPTIPVIGVNNGNPKYGYIMLRSETTALVDGWLQTQKRVARMSAEVEALEAFVKAVGIKEGTNLNTIPGMENARLIIEESHTPFYDGQDCKRYPDGSERAGEAVLSGGREVYRNTVVDTTGTKRDVLLPTDKEPVQADPLKAKITSEFEQTA
jgi:hypothetical protein